MKKFTLFFVALLISMTAFAATPQTIYMKSSSSVWDQANAWFWVHFWGSGDVDVKMTKVEGETGLYSVEVPSGSTNCIFVRMNPASTSVSWDGKWNQTGNLTIPTDGKNMYTVTGWGETDGSWSTYTSVVTPDPGEDPTPEPEPTTYTVYFDNNGTGWEKVNAYCWTVNSIFAWPGEAMTPVEGHSGFFSYTTTQSYENIIFNNGSGTQTADLKVPTDGKNCYNGETGTWSVYEAPDPSKPTVRFTNLTTTAQLGATVKPVAEVGNIENPTFVYTVSYEGGEAITLDENGYSLNDYGVYEFTVVATGDNDVTATATFTVTVELVAVLGSAELCHGYYWEKAKENAMYPVDGVYTITYKDVPAGTYEFKVAFGIGIVLGIESIDLENSTPGFTGENNISFTLSETTDIVISYSTLTRKVILKGVGLEKFGEFVATSYTLCGSEAIFVENFNTTLTANDMVETSTGVWTKTYSNVALQAEVVYYYKVAANYGWNVGQYPAQGDKSLVVEEAGNYNLTFTYEPNKAEGEKLVCDVEKIVEVEPTTYTVSFDNTNSGWEKVYAYCWNGEGDAAVANAAWPGVELTNPENNVYTYSTTTAYENVIFNAGEGKPQTANLVFENGKTYSIDVAYVLGTVNYERIANNECWSVDFAEHKMTYDANTGIWTKIYTDLPAGDYEFKLYCGIWLNSVVVDSVTSTPGFKYDNLGDNISFTLSDVATVTITYNSMLNTFAIVGQGIDKFGELEVTSYTLCGSKAIFGGEKDFDETLTANDMTGQDGVWTKTYEAVQLEAYNEETSEGVTYEYKVVANHKWNGAAYPSAGGYVVLWVATAGKYNLTFTFEPNKAEGEKLTVEIQPLAAPVVTLTESAYFVDNFEVVVTCEGKDADTKVYYQIGEAEALQYTAESVKITETSTIKAWSERYGQKSEVVVATYTKLNQPQLPESATFEDTKEIVITGAMVKYTLNGGEVKDYTAPFTIAETTTVVAWAQAGDVKTAEVSVTYTKQEVVVPEGPKVVTIAEFLAAEVNAEVWYELTGVITDIKSADYGNVTIKDETGSVYIYGLTKTQVSSNDKSFASLGLAVNDTVTIRSVRGEYNGVAQGGGSKTPAYFVSVSKYVAPEGGETPDPEEPVVPEVGDESTIFLANFNASGEYQSNSGSNDYINNHSYTVSGVVFNLKNCESAVSGSPLEGAAHIIARVAKNTTNTPTVETEAVTVKGSAITNIGFIYKAKNEGATMNVYTSPASGAETWTSVYSVKPTTTLSRVDLPVSLSDDIKLKFEWVVTSSTSSNRDYYLDSIYVKGTKPEGMVEKPIITPATKDCLDPIEVTISAEAGEIRYTLNGEEPIAESTLYTAPFTVSSTTTVKAVAIVNGKLSEVAVATYTFPAEVADIAALIADASGENVRIAGAVTVLAQTGKYLWVEDASMSMLVYGTAPTTYKNGDRLTGLVGKGSEFNGAKQIAPAYFPEAVAGTPVEPTVMALANVTAATVHQYIKLEGVTYTNATTLTAGDNTLAMHNSFGYTYAGEEGDKVDVIAIAGLYNKTVQVYPISIEKVATVEPTTFTVYFENTENWSTVNAYCWQTEGGAQNANWPGEAMTPVEGHDGFYSYTTTSAYDNIIFNNGDRVQTIDLTFPEDNNNVFTINGNDENGKKTGAWTVYVAPDPNKPVVSFTNLNPTAELGATIKPEATAKNIENPTYTYTVSYEGGEAIAVDENGYSLNDYGVYEFTVVATGDNDVTATATFTVTVELVAVLGSAELCHGYYWTENIKNAMYPVDGIYTITYEDVPVGTYEFKVAFGRSFMFGIENIDSVNSTKGFNGTNNISFTLSEVTDIKISYNPETEKVILVGVGLEQFAEFVATSYTLCGSKVIFGDEFNTTLTANDMVETSTGVWTKTYLNVVLEAGIYYYKVAANYAWNVGQYPASGDAILDIKEAGNYNLTFTYEPNKVEGEKLTCVVEKINQGPITEVENGTIANIYTQNGLIVVEGECQIFTITGQNVTQMNGNLIRGVYIVRTANATSKVIIK